MNNSYVTTSIEPLSKNVLTLSTEQCQLLLTGRIIGIRIGSNPDVSPEIMTLGVKIPEDLADTTLVSWSLHNAVVRKLEEQRNASRSSSQDAWAEVASLRERLKGYDDRLHKSALEREQARSERDFERKRFDTEQGTWLATRDANKELSARLKDANERIEKLNAENQRLHNRTVA